MAIVYKWFFIWELWITYAAPPPNWDIRATIRPPLSSGDYQQLSDDSEVHTGQNNKQSYTTVTNKDCMETLRTCETQRGICRVDLDIFKQFCGDWRNERSLLGCQKQFVKECRSALKTVNHGRPNLRHCTCDGQVSRSIDDLSKCNLLRRNLNSHPCLQEPPILFREHPKFNVDAGRPVQEVAGDRKDVTTDEQKVESGEQPSILNTTSVTFLNGQHQELTSRDGHNVEPSVEYLTETTTPIINSQQLDKESVFSPVFDDSMKNPPDLMQPSISTKHSNTSCLYLLEQCTNQPTCARILNQYRALCTPRSCEKLRAQCLLAHRAIERYGTHGNCSCDAERNPLRKQRCLDYEESVILNKCVALATEQTFEPQITHDFSSMELPKLTEVVSEDNSLSFTTQKVNSANALTNIPEWSSTSTRQRGKVDLGGSKTHGSNCYDVYRLCIRNITCLRIYLQLITFCLVSTGYSCPPSLACRNTLKDFYSQVAPFTYQALGCVCSEVDHDCQTQRAVFQPQCRDDTHHGDYCHNLWNQCHTITGCKEKIKFLLLDCSRTGNACSGNGENCMEAYRFWRSIDPLANCHCMDNEIFSLAPFGNSQSVTCNTLREAVSKPPCTTTDAQSTEENIFLRNPHSVSCFVTTRLNLSPATIIRVRTNETQTNPLPNASPCSDLCSCSGGCQHRLCSLDHGRLENGKQPKDNSLEENRADESIGQKYTMNNNPSPCLYVPMIDSSCSCRLNGDLWCDIFRNIGQNVLLDYQLVITYHPEELLSIVRLLTENMLNSELQYFTSLINIGHLLVDVIRNSTGNQNCGLILNENRIGRNGVRSKLNHSAFRSIITTPSSDLERQGYLVYAVITRSNLEDSWQSAYVTRENELSTRSQCLQSVNLLRIMINQRFGEIRYPAVLSVLKGADVIPRSKAGNPLSHSLNKTVTSTVNASTDDRSQGTHATWRQPRTSLAKHTVPVYGRNNGNGKMPWVRNRSPYMTLILSLLIWYKSVFI